MIVLFDILAFACFIGAIKIFQELKPSAFLELKLSARMLSALRNSAFLFFFSVVFQCPGIMALLSDEDWQYKKWFFLPIPIVGICLVAFCIYLYVLACRLEKIDGKDYRDWRKSRSWVFTASYALCVTMYLLALRLAWMLP